MSMLTMTPESLSAQIGATVPELYVTIAKNSITGIDVHGIADLLGVGADEIQQIQADEIYKSVRLLLAAEYARTNVESDFSWDAIESEALKGLQKRVVHERDTDMLLRIASIANKATRKNAMNNNKVLDPSQGGVRVAISLTKRITERLANGKQQTQEAQISITDGSAVNPKFEDIDALLGVSRKPQVAANMKITTHEPDFTVDDLEFKR